MEKSSLLRGSVLLVSTKIESPSSMPVPREQIRAASTADGKSAEKVQLVAIAKTPPAITLIQTASPNRGGKTYTEFPVDRNRAVYPGLHLGATFSSYMELTELMHKFQKAKGVHLYIRSSRKLYPAVNNMGGTVREYNLDLMFADIYYSCTKGGRRFCRMSSCSPAASSSSVNQEVRNCPFNIKLRLTRDGQKLYIRDIYPAHNHYLDRNSQPRIPHPSIVESKLRTVEKLPVLISKACDIRAVINKDFCDDGKRLVLLTKTSPRLLPVALTAAGANERNTVTVPQTAEDGGGGGGAFPDVIIKRNFADNVVTTASGILPSNTQETQESNMDLEPECILGMEEKIVPDVDDEEETATMTTAAAAAATTITDDVKSFIKTEILDECSTGDEGNSPSLHGDIDLPCSDRTFLISRQQILEMVKFCTECGSRIANRYYSDKSDSLGVALICALGHTVELTLGKQASTKNTLHKN